MGGQGLVAQSDQARTGWRIRGLRKFHITLNFIHTPPTYPPRVTPTPPHSLLKGTSPPMRHAKKWGRPLFFCRASPFFCCASNFFFLCPIGTGTLFNLTLRKDTNKIISYAEKMQAENIRAIDNLTAVRLVDALIKNKHTAKAKEIQQWIKSTNASSTTTTASSTNQRHR